MTVFQEDTGAEMSQVFGALAKQDLSKDLSGGVAGSYAIVSIRGSKFRIKYQGNEQPITAENGDPVGSLEAVIVKSNPYLTKQYYDKGYEEGDSGAPVCFSIDGVKPSEASEKKQHEICATCPQNKFGSRITQAGVKVKACQDNRKIAIVPLADIMNETFGGPMLMRIPASALKDLLSFGQQMSSRGYTYNSVAVRIGFDIEASYPKPTFRAIRPLNDGEAQQVVDLYNSDLVERVLADFDAAPAATAKPAADEVFEQPPAEPVKPAPAPPAPKPKAVAPKAPAPPAAKPVAAAPPAAKPAATGGATFGKKATAAPAAPVKAIPTPTVATVQQAPIEATAEVVSDEASPPGGLDNDIAGILAELNSTT